MNGNYSASLKEKCYPYHSKKIALVSLSHAPLLVISKSEILCLLMFNVPGFLPMKTIGSLYPLLIESNQEAFAQRQFVLAYHALSGAMHCALHLQDAVKLAEVEKSAIGQLQEIQERLCSSTPEPQEVNLYISLVQIIKTRRFLLQLKSTKA